MYVIKKVDLVSPKPGVIVAKFHDRLAALSALDKYRAARSRGSDIVHGLIEIDDEVKP